MGSSLPWDISLKYGRDGIRMTFLCYAKCTTCQKAKKWLVCVPVRRQKQSFLKALSEMYNKMILREYGDYQEFCENFNAIKQYVA